MNTEVMNNELVNSECESHAHTREDSKKITVDDVLTYFRRIKQNANRTISDDEQKRFIAWLELSEFRTGRGPITKQSIGSTFTSWLSIEAKCSQNKSAAPVSDELVLPAKTNFTEDDL